MKYFFVSEQFAIENDGFTKEANVFRAFRVENPKFQDRFVVTEQALIDFKEKFENLKLESVELSANDFVPDFTPPPSNGFAIVIPQEFQWAFPVKIEGYSMPMIDFNGKKVVEASYLLWKKAFDAFDKTQNSDYKNAMMKIFIYAKTNPEIIAIK